METVLFYLNDRFDFTPLQNSLFIGELGVMMLLTSTLLMKLLLYVTTLKMVVLFGLTMNLIHLVAYAVAWHPYVVYFIAAPCAAMSFVTFPCLTAIASQQQSARDQGKVMGVLMKTHKADIDAGLARKLIERELEQIGD